MAILAACAFAVSVAAQSRDTRTQAAGPPRPDAEAPLTNASVIKLARAKFSDRVIVAVIRSRPAKFDLSPDSLIELKKNGVSERVVLSMLERAGQAGDDRLARDADDEAFFGDLDGPAHAPGAGAQAGRSSQNETDIFGSSGGSSGESRTNGIGGGGSSATQTTGSVTARIIRPQEQGGGPAKLERTPTLTNQSIIDLVEAGFSEGTIIRRIEDSPADFDLSPQKLAELRGRRVTEPVIVAMRAAMSDDAPKTGARPQR